MKTGTRHEKIPFDDMRVPIRINAGMTLTEKNRRSLPLAWHEQLEILYFYQGGAVTECGSRRMTAAAGDIFIINPLQIHSVYYSHGQPKYDCVMVDRRVYNDLLLELCQERFQSYKADCEVFFKNDISQNPAVAAILRDLIRENRQDGIAANIVKKNLVQNLIIQLFRDAFDELRPTRENERAVFRYQRLEPVFRYIEEHLSDKITITELADLCALTPTYFCKYFKNTTGQTALDYINGVRLSKAELLLRTTDTSIAEIAVRTGFEDNGYFSRLFKRTYGISPREIRN